MSNTCGDFTEGQKGDVNQVLRLFWFLVEPDLDHVITGVRLPELIPPKHTHTHTHAEAQGKKSIYFLMTSFQQPRNVTHILVDCTFEFYDVFPLICFPGAAADLY